MKTEGDDDNSKIKFLLVLQWVKVHLVSYCGTGGRVGRQLLRRLVV